MVLLLVFALVLLAAVLISDLARRTVLSTAVLFLVAGFLLGDKVIGVLHLSPREPVVTAMAELALFSVLFTDGQQLGADDLRRAWRLPGRALLLGMPLTFMITAALGMVLAGLRLPEAMLGARRLMPLHDVALPAVDMVLGSALRICKAVGAFGHGSANVAVTTRRVQAGFIEGTRSYL